MATEKHGYSVFPMVSELAAVAERQSYQYIYEYMAGKKTVISALQRAVCWMGLLPESTG